MNKQGDWTIYHNPKCSKSRAALALLKDQGIEPQIIEYLKESPTTDQLKRIVNYLEGDFPRLVRKKDASSSDLDLKNADEIVDVLSKHPEWMERPVVVRGKRARIGRPPETVLELL